MFGNSPGCENDVESLHVCQGSCAICLQIQTSYLHNNLRNQEIKWEEKPEIGYCSLFIFRKDLWMTWRIHRTKDFQFPIAFVPHFSVVHPVASFLLGFGFGIFLGFIFASFTFFSFICGLAEKTRLMSGNRIAN